MVASNFAKSVPGQSLIPPPKGFTIFLIDRSYMHFTTPKVLQRTQCKIHYIVVQQWKEYIHSIAKGQILKDSGEWLDPNELQ